MAKKNFKIILALLEPPLPFGNAASRWYYVLFKQLIARGHQVKVFVACSKSEDIEKSQKLFPASEYDISYFPFPKRTPVLSKFETLLFPQRHPFSSGLREAIRQALKQDFDVLHIEQLWAGWLGLKAPGKTLLNIHHLQNIDLQFTQTTSLKEKWQFQRIFATERRLVRHYPYIRSCSPRLVPRLQHWNPSAYIETIPVGIDSSLYEYVSDEKRKQNHIISLIGNMGWYPSQSAAIRLLDRLWPEILKKVPQAKLQIVGWGARNFLKNYLDHPSIMVFENVADTKPFFENSNVMLYAPSRGSGMKIKILEAMGYGIPVITTSEGVEGLPAKDGVQMGICDEDRGLIERTVILLNDIELQNRQRKAARELLEQHCSPLKTVDDIERLYRKIIAKNRWSPEIGNPV